MKTPSKQVSFRLASESFEQLESRAKNYKLSCHEYARRLVLDALEKDIKDEQQSSKILAISDEVVRLREDLATIALALLVQIGGVDVNDATEWIEKNINL